MSSASTSTFTLDDFKSSRQSLAKKLWSSEIVRPWWNQQPMKDLYHNPSDAKIYQKFMENVVSYFERWDDINSKFPDHWVSVLGDEITVFGNDYDASNSAKGYANLKNDNSMLIAKVGWEHYFPDSPNANLNFYDIPENEHISETLGFASDIFQLRDNANKLYGGIKYFDNEPQAMTKGEFDQKVQEMKEDFVMELQKHDDETKVDEIKTAMGNIFALRGGTHSDRYFGWLFVTDTETSNPLSSDVGVGCTFLLDFGCPRTHIQEEVCEILMSKPKLDSAIEHAMLDDHEVRYEQDSTLAINNKDSGIKVIIPKGEYPKDLTAVPDARYNGFNTLGFNHIVLLELLISSPENVKNMKKAGIDTIDLVFDTEHTPPIPEKMWSLMRYLPGPSLQLFQKKLQNKEVMSVKIHQKKEFIEVTWATAELTTNFYNAFDKTKIEAMLTANDMKKIREIEDITVWRRACFA